MAGRSRTWADGRLYLRNTDPRNPLASPVYSDRRDLPPVVIDVGDAEVFLDDALRYAEGTDGVAAEQSCR